MHTVDGSIDSADARYKDPNTHTSVHYGVGLDGSVVQWVNESDTAYHAGNWTVDLTSLGIVHEDDGNDGPRTDQLYQASSQLIRQLCLRYGIPISTRYVVRHSTIAGAGTQCPGGLDVERIVAMASGGGTQAARAPKPAQIPEVDQPIFEAAATSSTQADSAVAVLALASQPASPSAGVAEADLTAAEEVPMTEQTVLTPAMALAPTVDAGSQAIAVAPTETEESSASAVPSIETDGVPVMTRDPLRDIATLIYGDPGRRQDIYDAIKGVVNDAPVLIQLDKTLSASMPASDPATNGAQGTAAETATSPADPTVPAAPASTTALPPAAPSAGSADKSSWGGSPSAVFAVQIFYLTILAGLAIAYFVDRSLISLPDTIGPLSLAVPWYGALGAVLISIVGVMQHRTDWDPSYRFWHWARPFLGASFGSISVLIFQAGILAVGSSPPTGAGSGGAVPKDLLYYLVAFVVGYREETFRALIKRLADVIFTPGGPTTN